MVFIENETQYNVKERIKNIIIWFILYKFYIQTHQYVPQIQRKCKSLSCVWLFVTPWTTQSLEFSRPEYWSGCLSLLQGIFPIQGLNPGLLHCRKILYQLSHQGSPRILEWVACPSPVGLPSPGIEPGSPALHTISLPTELSGKPVKFSQISLWI